MQETVSRPSSFPRTADLVVIGAGAIGLAASFRAGELGRRVVVLDSGAAVSGATSVAAGMLTLAHEVEDTEPVLVDFARVSLARYESFVAAVEARAGFQCGFRVDGSLFVALDRDDQILLERLRGIHQASGISSTLWDGGSLREREPNLSPRALGALFAPDDRQIDPRLFGRALAQAVHNQGGAVIERAAAIRIALENGRVAAVTCDGGRIATPAVIVAAGCHTNEVLPEGAPKLPLRPVKGQTIRLRGAPVIDRIVRTPRVYLAPRRDGEIVVGATMEEHGFDGRATVWAVQDMLTEARRTVPAIDELAVAELPVGFRPALRDNLPALGAYGPPGLFVATGHYRHGILLAPASADAMMGIVTGEHDDGVSPFDPNRFAAGRRDDRDHAERRADRDRSGALG